MHMIRHLVISLVDRGAVSAALEEASKGGCGMSYGAAGRCSHGAKWAVPRQEEAPLCRHRAVSLDQETIPKKCAP